MKKSETFFSDIEKKKISATIKDVEKKTAGEVAVMVVDHSGPYPEANILAGIIIGGLLSLIITDIFFNDSIWFYIPLTVVLALVTGRLAGIMPLFIKFFILSGDLDRRVEEHAVTVFYKQGLYRTKDESGVLFFISLLERRVWILADRGIYSKITQEELQKHAGDIATGIKYGRASDTLCEGIIKVGKILADHFPVKPDDVNELSDEVLTEH